MATISNNLRSTFRQIRWKLTLSYTAVTVGALLVVVLVLGYLLFSKVLIPLNILNGALSPKAWIQAASNNTSPKWHYILSQKPVDTRLISMMLQDGELEITSFDLFQIGDLQIRLRTVGQGSVILIDPDGIVLGTSNPDFVSEDAVGQALDMGILPGLKEPLQAALGGEVDADRLFVTIEANERFYFAIPYFDKADQDVLAVGIIYFESLATENDIPANILTLLSQSLLILLLAAGLVGAVFGAITANGMVKRFTRVSAATNAWSRGDFSEFIDDPTGDEISQLAQQLNSMAEQLQSLLKRRRAMAISEERNRLARDLHDSAKQQALAASFQLGTAITLFERDPQAARKHLLEADTLVDAVRKELTDLILELRPPTMNGRDFTEILNEYAIEWAHQNGIDVDVDMRGHDKLPLETEQTLYRIMQEALANVARHSSAGSVDIHLSYGTDAVTLAITDDGCGFDSGKQYDGIGLYSMRERAESLDGDFIIESEPGQGTKISMAFPTG